MSFKESSFEKGKDKSLDKEILLKNLIDRIVSGHINFEKISKLQEESGITDEEIQGTFLEVLTERLKWGDLSVLSFQEKFGITDEELESNEKLHNAFLEVLTTMIGEGYFRNIDKRLNLQEKFGITDEELKSNEELYGAFFKGLSVKLRKGDSHNIKELLNLQEKFGITDEELESNEELHNAFLEILTEKFKSGYSYDIKRLLNLQKTFGITNEELESNEELYGAFLEILTAMLRGLDFYHIGDLLNFQKNLGIIDKKIKSDKKFHNAFLEILTKELKSGYSYDIERLLNLQKTFGITDEELKSDKELYGAFLKGLTEELKSGDLHDIEELLNLQENLRITDEELKSDKELHDAFLENLIAVLKSGDLHDIGVLLGSQKKFGITNEELHSAFSKGLSVKLRKGDLHDIEELLNLRETFGITNEELKSNEELHGAFLEILTEKFKSGIFSDIKELLNLQKTFGITNEEFESNEELYGAFLEILIAMLRGLDFYHIGDLLNFQKNLGIIDKKIKSDKKFHNAFLEILTKKLKRGYPHNIKELLNFQKTFGITDEELKSDKELHDAFLKGLTLSLRDGYFCDIEEFLDLLQEKIGVEKQKVNKVLKEEIGNFINNSENFENSEDINSLFNFIEVRFGDYTRIKEFVEAEEKIRKEIEPYLDQAKKINPSTNLKVDNLRACLKVVMIRNSLSIEKLKEKPFFLDIIDKNFRFGPMLINAYFKYTSIARKKVDYFFENWSSHARDLRGLELRKKIQERLKDFLNNEEILLALKEAGIKVERWLNYNEEKTFKLRNKKAEKRKHKQIEFPLLRTIGFESGLEEGKSAVEDYKERLEELKRYFGDFSIKNPALISIEKALEEVGDNEGRKKSLERAKKNIKPILSVEDYIDEIIDKMEKKIKAIKENYAKLREIESLEGDHFKEREIALNNLRDKFNSLIKFLRVTVPEKINYLEERFKEEGLFFVGLPTDIFKEGRDEIESHLESDIESLKKVFSEQPSSLYNRELKIKVWDRDPHLDTYLGNYTGCCLAINIEEDYSSDMKEGIFDYLTDLGMQIVEVVDQETGNPVVSAWCWIGKNREGEPYLVVDNIEASTEYSSSFSSIIGKEMKSYIKKYAQTIGVKPEHIVMGVQYNDIKIREFQERRDMSIIKAGGYNERDQYYLDYYGEF